MPMPRNLPGSWFTHVPHAVNAVYRSISRLSVLDLGMNEAQTPALRAICKAQDRFLRSVTHDPAIYNYFHSRWHVPGQHEILLLPGGRTPTTWVVDTDYAVPPDEVPVFIGPVENGWTLSRVISVRLYNMDMDTNVVLRYDGTLYVGSTVFLGVTIRVVASPNYQAPTGFLLISVYMNEIPIWTDIKPEVASTDPLTFTSSNNLSPQINTPPSPFNDNIMSADTVISSGVEPVGWGVVVVDNEPARGRSLAMDAVANFTRVFVVHDMENLSVYRMTTVVPTFTYQKFDRRYRPHTLLLSNVDDVTLF